MAGGSGTPDDDIPVAPETTHHLVSKRPEDVARALAAVGGYVDAVGYLSLFRLFTAHQSGNSVGLGAALATGGWGEAWRRGDAIVAYVVGVALGTLIVEIGRRRGARSTGAPVSAAEVAALGVALGVGEVAARAGSIPIAATAPYAIAAACLAGAMGLQTVALRRVGRRTVRTTFVTGILANLAESFVAAWFQRDRVRRRKLLRFSKLLGSVWLVYLGGAVAGGLGQQAWSFAALAVPIVVVSAVAVWEIHAGYEPSLSEQGIGD